jgi:G6PDH family F420-dependent oxidoreductase
MLEQFGPVEVTEYAQAAEAAGFSGVMAADHFQPWVPQQGEAPFVWNVLTLLGERTAGDIGPGVTCPSFRFHPAVVAQASATLAAMYPDRHWLGLGSGEALNEHIVGGYWPEPHERLERMWEAIELIQKLFTGKDVRHDGKYFRLHTSRLWTMPQAPPPIYVATAGPVTARRAGRSVDGVITPGAPAEKVASLLQRFDAGAKEAGREPGSQPRILQLHLSWASTDEQALANAMTEWPNGGMKFPKQDIRSPYDFEHMAKLVRPEDFTGRMVISSDPDAHRVEIQKFLDLGVDRIYLHNVGRNQREWIDVFGRDVLPGLTR